MMIDTESPPGSWADELARMGRRSPAYDGSATEGEALVLRCRVVAGMDGHRDQRNALTAAADELERLYALVAAADR